MAVTSTVTNLELRTSNPDGSEGAGLSHSAAGLFLLHVLELAGEGEPRGGVTVVHDAGDHGARYQELATALAGDGWAVALPDLRGHGRSEGDRGHSFGPLEVLRDLNAVQDHLAYRLPEAPQATVGIGLGGLYALHHALEHPERVSALVLVGALLEPAFEPPKKPGGLLGAFKKLTPSSPGKTGYTAAKLTTQEAEGRAWEADALVHDQVSLRAIESIAECAAACRARLDALTVPLLVLHGGADALAAPASVQGLGAKGELRVLESLGHDLFHESGAAERVEDVRAWLDAELPRP